MGKGFNVFMKNPYWRDYYKNAPSDKLREFIALELEYSNQACCGKREATAIYAENKRIENELSVADFQYLIKHAGVVQAKIYYHQRIKEIIEKSGLHTVFHIPHDGGAFPVELMSSVIVSPEEFLSYHNEMRDAEVHNFVPNIPNSDTIAFGVSRLLCDVERLTDGTEVMEKYGMGFCYEKAYDGRTIKKISTEIENRTFKYYSVHHKKVDDIVKQHPAGLLLIDLHSYSEKIIVADMKIGGKPMPDICLGYDEKFCPQSLLNIAKECFSSAGLSVEINYPYSGSYIPNCVLSGQIKTPFASIMIEANKTAYMKCLEIDAYAVGKIKDSIFEMIALYAEI